MGNIDSKFELLAKSEPKITLEQHISDCLNIEKQLECCFSILPVENQNEFWRILRLAIIFHDTGKSHREFQKMLYGKGNTWNGQRHEVFSANFIFQSDLSLKDKESLYYPVIGHHKDIDWLKRYVYREFVPNTSLSFTSFAEQSYEEQSSKLLVNKTWKILHNYNVRKEQEGIPDIVDVITYLCKKDWDVETEDYLYHLLLVGYLKQCDHLASAGIQSIHIIEPNDFSFLYKFALYGHQERVRKCETSSFLSAPTGSGKTETSLLWLEQMMKKYGQGRAFYILPYTASINAMYERLSSDFDGNNIKKVGMIHGKLSQYIESKMDDTDFLIKKQIIEDYKTLVTPLKVVTPFQLLKHIFGLKGFEKGIAEWCGSYLIFDEIHAYDSKTFAQIIVLLEFCVKLLNVKVFIMTATLPTFMLKYISDAIGTNRMIKADESLYKSFVRHKVIIEDSLIDDAFDLIQVDLNKKKKVLIVCNTVEKAQLVYRALDCSDKMLLHGSFNALDRSQKEQMLNEHEVSLLVGTQAVEVSLDIDYDTIYTEPAPIDALIQRFGRVNRKRKKGLCLCHVFKKSGEKDRYIYDEQIVNRSLEAFSIFCFDGVIHEENIQEMIDYVYPCFNVKQLEEYNNTYECLKTGIKTRLMPLHYDEKNEQDYYSQFDGVKVLPVSLKEKYSRLMSESKYIKAEGLLVSIRESRFSYMYRNGDVIKDRICFEYSDDKLVDKSVLIINRQYDSEMGLMINNPESESINDVFL